MWLGYYNYGPHSSISPGDWRDLNGTGVRTVPEWGATEPNDVRKIEYCTLMAYDGIGDYPCDYQWTTGFDTYCECGETNKS